MKIGTIDISDLKIGTSDVKLYIGTVQVWPVNND